MDVRALVFDVFGTVVDWHGGVAREVRRLLPGVDADAFATAWRWRYEPSMDRVRRGERACVVLEPLARVLPDRRLDEFGQNPDVSTPAELLFAFHLLRASPVCIA